MRPEMGTAACSPEGKLGRNGPSPFLLLILFHSHGLLHSKDGVPLMRVELQTQLLGSELGSRLA